MTPIHVPQENVNDESVTLVAWLVADGARVDEGQEVAELEGSKATFAVRAPVAGVVRYTFSKGDEIPVGGLLCHVGAEGEAVPPPGEPEAAPALAIADVSPPTLPEPAPVAPRTPTVADHVPATPAKSRISKEAAALIASRGLDPTAFASSGMVRARDVLAHLGEAPASPTPMPAVAAKPAVNGSAPPERPTKGPVAAVGVPTRSEPLPRAKLTEIKYLRSAFEHALPSSVSVEVPTRGLRASAAGHPHLRGNPTALIVHEAARLLRKYPRFNAFFADGQVVFYEEIHVGFAVDAGHGLKVPVVRRADTKTVPEIAAEMQERLVEYLGDALPIETLAGGTFTVSDLSGEGASGLSPLLNRGQGAILGVSCGSGDGGQLGLTLAFDHQIAEGRMAAQFLNDLKARLLGYESALGRPAADRPAAPDLGCSECLMGLADLREMGAFLLPTVAADGSQALVCSICLVGF